MERISFLSKSNYLSYAIAFSLSFLINGLAILIGVWVLSLLIQFILKPKIQFQFNVPQKILLAFYFMYVIGLLWSSNRDAALFALEVKLSLMVFPLTIGLNRDFFRQNSNQILLSFMLGLVFSSLLCLIVAFWESTFFLIDGFNFNTIDPEYADWEYGGSHFRYINLSLFVHPTYFSVYILFALAIAVKFLEDRIFTNKSLLIVMKMSVPLFLVMIYLLSSKAVITSTIILFIFYSFNLYHRFSSKFIRILIPSIFPLFIFVALQNPRFNTILQAIDNPEYIIDHSNDGSFTSRIHIWKAGLKLISNNFLLGVGPGDTNTELVDVYKYYNYLDPVLKNSNAHNQYIETAIDIGFFGFAVLLAVLFYPFYLSFKKRNYLFLVFLFIIGFNFLFESFLNLQAGVIFFAFFYSLLGSLDEEHYTASGVKSLS